VNKVQNPDTPKAKARGRVHGKVHHVPEEPKNGGITKERQREAKRSTEEERGKGEGAAGEQELFLKTLYSWIKR